MADENTTFRLRNKVPPVTSLGIKRKAKKKAVPGELAFDKLIDFASYEVHTDPYRGMAGNGDDSPWKACLFGQHNESKDGEDTDLVRDVCQCDCPTLRAWTCNRKDKKLGMRPSDANIVCSCDYNPFCLGTLGGAINEVLENRYNEFSPADGGKDSDVVVVEDENEDRYRDTTRKKLRSVRMALLIEKKPVRTYLQDILNEKNVDVCIEAIQKWHHSLCFSNPVDEKTAPVSSNPDQIRISVPPGIENLGATCYLNTQLQCLAQNRIFMQGILSWSNDGEDQMTTVIRLFQQLLSRMQAGPDNVLNTVEFSNALGLDHYEQQDPNEFSRLFFDKLHESFQKTEACKSLLPHLFQGTASYKTVCLACQNETHRNETFMDLNLAIAPKPKPAAGQQSLLETFAKDTDVQHCLDQYCRIETLQDDNQYFCSNCDCKRDATRQLVLEKLPPVLNVQLSRYVFDMKTLSKRKVEDKVVLPLNLSVPAGSSHQRYKLAAVMRHQGKSAYSGHYVAEAMDWPTGRWFAFNDEQVSYLEKGPSCAWNGKGVAPAGSSDAYNMYYVEEEFLAQSVLESCQVTTAPGGDREGFYHELARLCLEDAEVWEKLNQRRSDIQTAMLGCLFSPLPIDDALIWVEATKLRSFLSCRRSTDLKDFPFGPGAQDPCIHGKLHPRTARKGKLLTREMYDAYVLLVSKALRQEVIPKSVFTKSNLVCQECAAEYKGALRKKLEIVQAARRLYEGLDPKNDNFSLRATSPFQHESDRLAFIVSKKFVTKFRQAVTKLMKMSLVLEVSTTFDEVPTRNAELESLAEGLDAFDLSTVTQTSGMITENSWPQNEIVNDTITCVHGSCKLKIKRSIRYVPWSVWVDIQLLFPSAIEHKRIRLESDSSEESNMITFCRECERELDVAATRKNELVVALGAFRSAPVCDVVSEEAKEDNGKRSSKGYRLVHAEDIDAWKKFIAAAKRKVARGSNDVEEQARETLRPFVRWNNEELVPFAILQKGHEQDRWVDELAAVVRPMSCQKHKLPLRAAIFADGTGHPGQRPGDLNNGLRIVGEDAYEDMISQWVNVAQTVFSPRETNTMVIDDTSDEGESTILASGLASPLEWFHPRFSLMGTDSEVNDSSVFSLSSKSLSMLFSVDGAICDDLTCNAAYRKWRTAEEQTRLERDKKNTPIVVEENKIATGGAANDPITVDCDPDPVSNMLVSLRVCETQSDAALSSILSDLAITPESVDAAPDMSPLVRRSSRRRKQRYPTGSILAEDDVKFDTQGTVAALRLSLMERCTHGGAFELSDKLQLIIPGSTEEVGCFPEDHLETHSSAGNISTTAADTENSFIDKRVTDADNSSEKTKTRAPSTTVVDLPLDVSGDLLVDVISRELGLCADSACGVDFSKIVIIRQRMDDVGNAVDPNLMDHMLSLAGVASGNTKSGQKKKIRVERGFTGTLLSSGGLPTVGIDSTHDLAVDGGSIGDKRKMTEATEQNGSSSNGGAISRTDSWDRSLSEAKRAKVSNGINLCEHHDEEKKEMTSEEKAGFDSIRVEVANSAPRCVTAQNPGDDQKDTVKPADEEELAMDMDKAMNIVASLLQYPDIDESHQSSCLDAALWAIKRNEALDDDQLLATAYAKYLDTLINFPK